MFPNVRLMIVAVMASIMGMSCALGLFAEFRVSHESFLRASNVSAPLQIVSADTTPAGLLHQAVSSGYAAPLPPTPLAVIDRDTPGTHAVDRATETAARDIAPPAVPTPEPVAPPVAMSGLEKPAAVPPPEAAASTSALKTPPLPNADIPEPAAAAAPPPSVQPEAPPVVSANASEPAAASASVAVTPTPKPEAPPTGSVRAAEPATATPPEPAAVTSAPEPAKPSATPPPTAADSVPEVAPSAPATSSTASPSAAAANTANPTDLAVEPNTKQKLNDDVTGNVPTQASPVSRPIEQAKTRIVPHRARLPDIVKKEKAAPFRRRVVVRRYAPTRYVAPAPAVNFTSAQPTYQWAPQSGLESPRPARRVIRRVRPAKKAVSQSTPPPTTATAAATPAIATPDPTHDW